MDTSLALIEKGDKFAIIYNEILQDIEEGKITLNSKIVDHKKFHLVVRLLLNEILMLYEIETSRKLCQAGNEIRPFYWYIYKRFQTRLTIIIHIVLFKLRSLINSLPSSCAAVTNIKLLFNLFNQINEHSRKNEEDHDNDEPQKQIDETAFKAAYMFNININYEDPEVFRKTMSIIFADFELKYYVTKEQSTTGEFIKIVLQSFKNYDSFDKFLQYVSDVRRRTNDSELYKLMNKFIQLLGIHMNDTNYHYYRNCAI